MSGFPSVQTEYTLVYRIVTQPSPQLRSYQN